MKDKVSRILALSPDSKYSPSYLARVASTLGKDVFIKQTCYGILVEGDEGNVEFVLNELRKLDPNRMFSKLRAFPLGDKRRCRAQRGSARPGFYFLQKEIELLPNIAKGLECKEEITAPKTKTFKKLDPSIFKKIIDESVV